MVRIGEVAPGFEARSTVGRLKLSDYRGRWIVLFSHPADFTPVCTTEFVAMAKSAKRFEKLGCELMAVSIDSLYAHFAWLKAIKERFDVEVRFPIVEDPTLVIGRAYGMIDEESVDSGAVRSSFFIDPEGIVRAITSYPASVGRSVDEMVRLVAALQESDRADALAPEGWEPGQPLLQSPHPTLDGVFQSEGSVDWFFGEASR